VADAFRSTARWWLGHGLGPLLVRWWRRRGLRARVTMIAALALIVAFILIDLLLFNALRVSLTRSVDDTARSGAEQVASLSNAGRLPDPVPVAGDITIQVLNSYGDIKNASASADRLVPIVSLAQAQALAHGGGAMLVQGAPFDMPSLLRVVVVRADGGDLVLAAVPFSEASGSLNVVARALVIVTPLLFVAFTGAIWLVTGSTLRPIGALRRGAAQVTVTGVPADLPVPEARDEVRLLAVTLNDMLTRLAAAQQRQRALVSDTAHELRSPIASIRTQLEVALDFPDGQDWATTARDVHADVLRLARLAEDLLLLARLDEQAGLAASNQSGANGARAGVSPEVARRSQLVDLGALSQSVACRYADARVQVTAATPDTRAPDARDAPDAPDAADAHDAAGVHDAPNAHAAPNAADAHDPADAHAAPDAAKTAAAVATSDAVLVHGVPEGLERLLVNLVDNAVRYAKSSVVVTVRQNAAWAELSVTDDGSGIPAADRERAFGRFARLDDARSREGDEAGGAGLGLAIVRATARAHGGTAFLEAAEQANPPTGGHPGSAPGLRAVVCLPAAQPSA
jgi:signal transduction histidine kinase